MASAESRRGQRGSGGGRTAAGAGGRGGRMRRGGARGGLLWAAALLGMAASAAWAQQTPDRCSVVNLQDAFLEAFSACEASGGSASAGCCKAVEGFTAGSSTGAADCLCYQDTYDSLKDLVKDQGFKTFFIDDIAKGCSADFGVKVGTPKNRCNADQPDADADAGADPGADADQPDGPVEPEAPMTCAGMRKKACRRKSGGNCFFFRKVCPWASHSPPATAVPTGAEPWTTTARGPNLKKPGIHVFFFGFWTFASRGPRPGGLLRPGFPQPPSSAYPPGRPSCLPPGPLGQGEPGGKVPDGPAQGIASQTFSRDCSSSVFHEESIDGAIDRLLMSPATDLS